MISLEKNDVIEKSVEWDKNVFWSENFVAFNFLTGQNCLIIKNFNLTSNLITTAHTFHTV